MDPRGGSAPPVHAVQIVLKSRRLTHGCSTQYLRRTQVTRICFNATLFTYPLSLTLGPVLVGMGCTNAGRDNGARRSRGSAKGAEMAACLRPVFALAVVAQGLELRHRKKVPTSENDE